MYKHAHTQTHQTTHKPTKQLITDFHVSISQNLGSAHENRMFFIIHILHMSITEYSSMMCSTEHMRKVVTPWSALMLFSCSRINSTLINFVDLISLQLHYYKYFQFCIFFLTLACVTVSVDGWYVSKQTRLTNLMATCSLLYRFFPEIKQKLAIYSHLFVFSTH